MVTKLSKTKTKTPKRVGKLPPDQSPLTAYMIGTDPGNGKSEAWRYVGGELRTASFPHGRIAVTGYTLNKDVMAGQHQIDYVDWPGVGGDLSHPARYTFGEGILGLTADSTPETHRNSESRYGDDLHIFSVIRDIYKLGVESGSHLIVVVPAPPGMINEVGPRIKKAIRAGEEGRGDGAWSIRGRGKKNWMTYFIDKVIVVPEGALGFAAYRYDINGNVVPLENNGRDLLAGHVVVMDGGYGTLDTFDIIDGDIAPESIRHATDPEGGIQKHMIAPILSQVVDWTSAKHLTEMHVDSWLRQWATGGYTESAATQTIGGRVVKMHNLFVKTARDYANWLSREKVERAWRRGADSILAVGGTWMYVDGYVREAFPQRTIVAPWLFEHVNWCPVYALNGYGCLPMLAANLREFQD